MSGPRALPHDWFPRPLPEGVEVGEGSWIYSAYAFLHSAARRPGAVRIGRSSGVYHGTFFELGPDAEVEIGDFVALVGATIRTDRRVSIGHCTFVAHEVVIADGPFARPPDVAPGSGEGEEIVIGENVWIGARAVLLGGARIGDDSVVGAAAVVDFEVPPGSVVAGNPARVVGPVRRPEA